MLSLQDSKLYKTYAQQERIQHFRHPAGRSRNGKLQRILELVHPDVRDRCEDDTVAERMLPYTGNQPQKRHACIAVNLQGGGGFEIWQYSERKPKPVAFDIAVGDLGVFAAKLNCRDVPACHKALSAKWNAVSEVSSLPDGTPCFYVKELYGN